MPRTRTKPLGEAYAAKLAKRDRQEREDSECVQAWIRAAKLLALKDRLILALADRVHKQAELLSRRAEKPTDPARPH